MAFNWLSNPLVQKATKGSAVFANPPKPTVKQPVSSLATPTVPTMSALSLYEFSKPQSIGQFRPNVSLAPQQNALNQAIQKTTPPTSPFLQTPFPTQPTQTQIQAGKVPSPTSPTQTQIEYTYVKSPTGNTIRIDKKNLGYYSGYSEVGQDEYNRSMQTNALGGSSVITQPSGSALSGGAPGASSGSSTGSISAPGGSGAGSNIMVPGGGETKEKSAWEKYIESLTPTDEESKLQEQIDALNQKGEAVSASQLLGEANIGANEPMPMQDVTGFKAQMQRQASAQLTGLGAQQKPLLDRLAQLQANRTNQGKVYEAMIGMQKPFEVSAGSSTMQFNPDTGKYEVAYTAPNKEDASQSLDRFLTATELASYNLPAGSTFADAILKGSIPKENLTGVEKINIAERIANQFDGEQLVKDFNQVVGARNMVQQIANDSKNPADNQALIYAFAKIMDPNSVVREGEYNTVQKYSQSWLEQFGFNAMRVFNNQEFLTPEAVGMIKSAIEKKYNGNLYAYQNLASEYGRRIDRISGQSDGMDYITNYALGSMNGGEASTMTQEEFNTLKAEFPDLTDEEIINLGSSPGFNSGSGGTPTSTGSVSFRNNNPLNIKYGNFASSYGAKPGTTATDGGQFAYFSDVETGMRAAKDLLKSSSYSNLTLEAAMRRWSGNGYGADVASELKNKKISQMTDAELNTLIEKMKQREGWVPNNYA